ncbi:MAG: MFS transporter [Actinobacteria bacterium]|nr:MFS transporter [Actinomycetota bacterium]
MRKLDSVDQGRLTGAWPAVMVALVFLVALNLRPSLTTVGPLLPQLEREVGLSEALQGLLGSVPLLAFALVSPLVHHLSKRFGMERAILIALLALVAGVAVRSFTGDAGLWLGTALLGSAIAVGNVLVPTLVKRDYSAHISRATGIYSACINIGASLAAAAAVPLAVQFGWRGSMAFWAIPALVVAVLWLPRTRVFDPEPELSGDAGTALTSVWRQPTAWLLTAFMGLQSTTFYLMVTWLPTVEIAAGISERQAGWHLFVFQIVGIFSALAAPRLLRRADSQVGAAVTVSIPMLIGALGLLVLPQLGLLWAIVAGLGSGGALVVALSLISLRGRTHSETTQLSGMAQSLGYLLAAVGPVLAGYLAQRTGSWYASLAALGVFAALQLVIAIPVGRVRQPIR